MSDEDEILRGLSRDAGNQRLWGEFYDQIEPHLRLFSYSLARGYSGIDPSQADDVVQDVMLAFVRNFATLRSKLQSFAHVRNYLLKACRNRFLNLIQQNAVRKNAHEALALRLSEASPGLGRVMTRSESRRLLEQILGRLEEPCVSLVRAYLIEDKTLAEFSQSQGVRLGTVYSQWRRCVEAMKAILDSGSKENPP